MDILSVATHYSLYSAGGPIKMVEAPMGLFGYVMTPIGVIPRQ